MMNMKAGYAKAMPDASELPLMSEANDLLHLFPKVKFTPATYLKLFWLAE
jgi:hypothetical protein